MRENKWAPCLHDPKDKAKVGPWLLAILNDGDYRPWAEDDLFIETDIPKRTYYTVKKLKNGKPGKSKVHVSPAHVQVSLNPKLTESLLWMIADLQVPTGRPSDHSAAGQMDSLKLNFYSDQWVGISAMAHLQGKDENTWVEADDFTLALAKTLEVWRAKIKGETK